jgi:hypothetical protein
MTERLHVAGEASGRLQKCRAFIQSEVFTAAIGMKEFS